MEIPDGDQSDDQKSDSNSDSGSEGEEEHIFPAVGGFAVLSAGAAFGIPRPGASGKKEKRGPAERGSKARLKKK